MNQADDELLEKLRSQSAKLRDTLQQSERIQDDIEHVLSEVRQTIHKARVASEGAKRAATDRKRS